MNRVTIAGASHTKNLDAQNYKPGTLFRSLYDKSVWVVTSDHRLVALDTGLIVSKEDSHLQGDVLQQGVTVTLVVGD